MKLNRSGVLEALGIRVAEGDHLVDEAVKCYTKLRAKGDIQYVAHLNRKHFAEEGRYLQALIHDQIYRLAGGED